MNPALNLKCRQLIRNFIKLLQEKQVSNKNDYFSPTRVEGELNLEPVETNEKDDKILCLINTHEPHLRRAVEKRSNNWAEHRTKNAGSHLYDIKFEF